MDYSKYKLLGSFGECQSVCLVCYARTDLNSTRERGEIREVTKKSNNHYFNKYQRMLNTKLDKFGIK